MNEVLYQIVIKMYKWVFFILKPVFRTTANFLTIFWKPFVFCVPFFLGVSEIYSFNGLEKYSLLEKVYFITVNFVISNL